MPSSLTTILWAQKHSSTSMSAQWANVSPRLAIIHNLCLHFSLLSLSLCLSLFTSFHYYLSQLCFILSLSLHSILSISPSMWYSLSFSPSLLSLFVYSPSPSFHLFSSLPLYLSSQSSLNLSSFLSLPFFLSFRPLSLSLSPSSKYSPPSRQSGCLCYKSSDNSLCLLISAYGCWARTYWLGHKLPMGPCSRGAFCEAGK